MALLSGTKAAVKITSAVVTTSTNLAAVLSTDEKTLILTDASKRHWDIDSTGFPKVYDHSASTSVAVAVSAYTVDYVRGRINFTTAHSTASTYKVDAQYVTASSWLNARQWSLSVQQNILDNSVFGSTWRLGQPGLRAAGASVGGFWKIDGTSGDSTGAMPFDRIDTGTRVLAELYPSATAGDRYEGYAYITGNQVQAGVDALVGETVEFTFHGPVWYTTST